MYVCTLHVENLGAPALMVGRICPPPPVRIGFKVSEIYVQLVASVDTSLRKLLVYLILNYTAIPLKITFLDSTNDEN